MGRGAPPQMIQGMPPASYGGAPMTGPNGGMLHLNILLMVWFLILLLPNCCLARGLAIVSICDKTTE